MRLDGVRFSLVDVAPARDALRVLLGIPSIGMGDGIERFQLHRGAIELQPGRPQTSVLFATERGDDLTDWPTTAEEHGGLSVCVISAPDLQPVVAPADGIAGVDHVVVNTRDPKRAVAHWHQRLGLRLALDKEFADRGLRLQFFRSGGMTLEFASRQGEGAATSGTDAVYGVSYRVHDLAACRARLLGHGLDVSEIRAGMKEGTRVATVRDGTAGVPTLLIEHPRET
jgi:catechol 2,3-dioxygenase-like lactoylglutathione lyase family enzyme